MRLSELSSRRFITWLNGKIRSHFVSSLLLVIAVGVFFSEQLAPVQSFDLFPIPGTDRHYDMPTLFLSLLVISASTKCRPRDFRRLFEFPKAGLASLILIYAVVPMVAAVFGLIAVWILPEGVGVQLQLGLTLTAMVPVTMTAAMWVRVNHGNLPAVVAVLIVTMSASLVSIPFYLGVLPGVAGSDVELPVASIVQLLLLAVSLPLVIGLMFRQCLPEWTERWNPLFSLCGTIGLWGAVLGAVATAMPSLMAHASLLPKLVVLTVALNLACFWVGVLVARGSGLTYEDAVALVFSSGMRSNGTSLVVGLKSFPTLPFVTVPAAIYIISQHLVAAYMTRRFESADLLWRPASRGNAALMRHLRRVLPRHVGRAPGLGLLTLRFRMVGTGPQIPEILNRLRRVLRVHDTLCTLPPHTLAVVLSSTSRANGEIVAQKLRRVLEEDFSDIAVRVSLAHSDQHESAGALVAAAVAGFELRVVPDAEGLEGRQSETRVVES